MGRLRADKGIKAKASRDRAVASFDERLAQAESRLRRDPATQEGADTAPTEAEDGGAASLMGFAARVGTEMVAALAVGALIGYGLDRLFGFRALFLIVFALAGGAAGTLNVLRAAEKLKI